jgi:hypothetical protein
MQASGLTQMGGVSRGRLAASQSIKLPLELSAECLTVVAMGDEGVADVSLALKGVDGKEVARDDMIGPDASMRYCPDQPGKYELELSMAKGSGGYAVSVWTGGVPTRRVEAAPQGALTVEGGGSCEAPTILVAGQTYVGNTEDGRKMEEGSCGNTNARELVYRLDLVERQRVSLDLRAEYDGVLYVRRGDCADPEAEVACNDDAPGGGRRSRVDEVLDAGTYYVFVDGYGEEEGAFRLTVQLRPAGNAQNQCEEAPSIVLGTVVRGSLVDGVNNASATCGNDAKGPDVPFRLDLASRSRVRIQHQASGYPPVVHVRSSCERPESEEGCSATGMAVGEATFTGELNAGTHYVFADAAQLASGDYALTVQAADAVGGGAQGDTCGEAISMMDAEGSVVGDTFEARHDVRIGCAASALPMPDVMYRLDILRKSMFYARINRDEGRHLMALQPRCGSVETELACGSEINQLLSPGVYWLVVKSAAVDSFGRFELGYRINDLAPLEKACADATTLVSNRVVTGTTSDASNVVDSSCVGGARTRTGPDRLHKFSLARRSDVIITVLSEAFHPAVTLQRDCVQPSVIECVTRYRSVEPARITRTLEAGTYYVVVDAKEAGTSGQYTVELQVQAPKER